MLADKMIAAKAANTSALQAKPWGKAATLTTRMRGHPGHGVEKTVGRRKQEYPDRESNSDLLFRRELFYPLNYQGNLFFSLQRYSKYAEITKKREFIFVFRPICCNFVV